MKLPQALLGAMLVGLAAQATSCTTESKPVVKQEQDKPAKPPEPASESYPDACPACGMG